METKDKMDLLMRNITEKEYLKSILEKELKPLWEEYHKLMKEEFKQKLNKRE